MLGNSAILVAQIIFLNKKSFVFIVLHMAQLHDSELIINPDGSIYHLGLRPEDIAHTIILVGDPQRVQKVSQHFDHIEVEVARREFVTCTGRLGNQRLTCVATGIGTDNIDIVLNELDALVNVDFGKRQIKTTHTPLTLVRLGTSGSIREDLPVDQFLVADYGVGLEGLMLFYQRVISEQETILDQNFKAYLQERDFEFPIKPYVAQAAPELVEHFQAPHWNHGISLTATGFYAPQNRGIRAQTIIPDLFSKMDGFTFNGLNITNLEMETAGIYGMARALGHRAIALNAILANRPTGVFSSTPKVQEKRLIEGFFEVLNARVL